VLAIVLSWLAWVPLVVLPHPGTLGDVLLVAGSFGPTAAALILTTARSGWAWTRRELASRATWRHPVSLWVVALTGPAAIILVAIAFCTVAGRPVVGWQDPARLYLIIPVFLYVTVLGGPLGEEPGWRGYALPRLQRDHSPTTAALGVGLVWGLWHAPLFAIDGTVQRSVPVAAFGAQILITSVLYAWLWNRTTSLPVVIAFHAAVNTSVGLLPVLPETAGSPWPLWTSLALAAVVAAALIGATGGRLGLRVTDRPDAGSPADERRSSSGEATRFRARRVER
jgi:membrane protease YdiL (CAAX protease family)